MTPETYQRLKPLYEAALQLPPPRRAAFIDQACAGDPQLHAELEAILAANEGTDTFDKPLVDFNGIYPAKRPTLTNGDILLNRFKIVRFIDAGGMGEVYEAEDSFLRGVHVALKTILPHIAGDPDIRKRFEREVLLAREVSHPNLCPIYDIFHCEQPPPGFLFLTMKLLPGDTLSARLDQDARIPVDDGLAIVAKASLGLAAIHDAGIVHRDIKPNNIMLDGSGPALRLWITDFGLARAYQNETTLSGKEALAGTPGYIAPELLLGHLPSQASDLFAFGVVLHEVFTGEKPTPAPNSSSYVVSPRLTPPKVPLFCVELIKECLHNDPKRRCQAFERALGKIDPKLDRSRGSGQKLWTRRRFTGATAASFCVIAGSAWWKWDAVEDELHPLPQKRFVALLNWPKSADVQSMPMLTGVLAAINGELSRIEAFDRDLFVISPGESPENMSEFVVASRLREICDPLGANLALAASVVTGSAHFQLLLRLLDPSSSQVLRQKKLLCALSEIASLPEKAVHAAGSLLNLSQYLHAAPRQGPGTRSIAAFSALQAAEALMNEPDDTGLDAAIEKYKQAVDLDPQYALAHAELAEAYLHCYQIRHDPGALDLARGNCERALALKPNLVEGLVAHAVLFEKTGNEEGALREFAKALAVDPSNPETLWAQAQVYLRLNRWADAEHTYERIIRQRPNSWVTYNEKGVVLDHEGKYKDAVQAFRTASLAAPRCSLALANLGGEYLEVGDFAAAVESSKKSMELRANDLAAVNTSQALRCQGKCRDALPFALKAVELDPSDDTNWLELGDCYSSLGGHARQAKDAYLRAEKEAERHLATDRAHGPSWMLLALYKVKAGDPQNALSLIQKAEALGAQDMSSQLRKSRILELIGRRDEALDTIAACFRKGATALQISAFADMQSLRHDSRYLELVQSLSTSAHDAV